MLDDPYLTLKNSDKPDKDIEIFWYSLKSMVMNTFNDQPPIELDKYSEILNNLQSKEEYLEIEKHILEYILLVYAVYMLSTNVQNIIVTCFIHNLKDGLILQKNMIYLVQ